jgi:hypothetical protein
MGEVSTIVGGRRHHHRGSLVVIVVVVVPWTKLVATVGGVCGRRSVAIITIVGSPCRGGSSYVFSREVGDVVGGRGGEVDGVVMAGRGGDCGGSFMAEVATMVGNVCGSRSVAIILVVVLSW